MTITSSSLSIHAFLNKYSYCCYIIPVLRCTVCMYIATVYVHVMHMCIYGFMEILKLDLC